METTEHNIKSLASKMGEDYESDEHYELGEKIRAGEARQWYVIGAES